MLSFAGLKLARLGSEERLGGFINILATFELNCGDSRDMCVYVGYCQSIVQNPEEYLLTVLLFRRFELFGD